MENIERKHYGVYEGIDGYNIIPIKFIHDIELIRKNPSGNFKIMQDIDLKSIDNFEPIEGFNGVLDGNGKEIKNLKIDRTASNTGLFSKLNDKSVINNLILKNVNITGTQNVGSIAGINEGKLINCQVIGENNIVGEANVGGLAGQSYIGDIDNCIVYLYKLNAVEYVGGLVGNNESDINCCEVIAPGIMKKREYI